MHNGAGVEFGRDCCKHRPLPSFAQRWLRPCTRFRTRRRRRQGPQPPGYVFMWWIQLLTHLHSSHGHDLTAPASSSGRFFFFSRFSLLSYEAEGKHRRQTRHKLARIPLSSGVRCRKCERAKARILSGFVCTHGRYLDKCACVCVDLPNGCIILL